MSSAPIFELDINTFWKNPYPILKEMRKNNQVLTDDEYSNLFGKNQYKKR